jgi:diacylglycerol kinase family enzyme
VSQWAARPILRVGSDYSLVTLGPVRALLIVNPRAGSGRPAADELRAEAARRGISAHVLAPGEDAQRLAREADADVLGVAGGDGSLGPIAQTAVARGLPFVCIPYGTRNHFARDLGLDAADPITALEAFAGGRERVVDIGRVDRHVFLNNVSFGIYADLVHRREGHRRRRDALARARALWLTARDPHPEPIVVDGEPVEARVVLVANNAYELDVFNVGARARLDEGKLYAYIAEGWLPATWSERTATSYRIGTPGGRVRAAVDGEPAVLESPAELTIEAGALRVLLPTERET